MTDIAGEYYVFLLCVRVGIRWLFIHPEESDTTVGMMTAGILWRSLTRLCFGHHVRCAYSCDGSKLISSREVVMPHHLVVGCVSLSNTYPSFFWRCGKHKKFNSNLWQKKQCLHADFKNERRPTGSSSIVIKMMLYIFQLYSPSVPTLWQK